MKRYFINGEEVTLERFKKEYDVMLKLWLLDVDDNPEVAYESEMNDMFSDMSSYASATTKFLGYEFKIIKEEKRWFTHHSDTWLQVLLWGWF